MMQPAMQPSADQLAINQSVSTVDQSTADQIANLQMLPAASQPKPAVHIDSITQNSNFNAGNSLSIFKPNCFRSDPTINPNCSLMYIVDNSGLPHMLDTGSQVTALPRKLAPSDFKQAQLPFNLFSANESPVTTYGYHKFTVSIRQFEFQYEFVVADIANIVLGIDFFRAFGWILNPKANTVMFSQTVIQCYPTRKPSFNLHAINSYEPVIDELVGKHKSLFDINEPPLHQLNQVKHCIELKPNAVPTKAPTYHYAPDVEKKIFEHFQQLLDQGICRVSESLWASPLVVVPKRNGQIRCPADYRNLNKYTLSDSYSLPNMSSFTNRIRGAKFLSVIDVDKAFYRVPMREKDIPLTAVQTPHGLLEFVFMPFGLKTAAQTFQRLINTCLRPHFEFSFAFIDDILSPGYSATDHAEKLDKIFSALEASGLKVNRDKCQLFREKVIYLGYEVDSNGIHPTPDRIKAIEDWPVPKTFSELKSFLCSVNFYMKMVRNYADTSSILTSIPQPKSKNEPIDLTTDQLQAFYELKSMLINYTMLCHPVSGATLILESDASDKAMGACLSQIVDGRPEPLFFFSRAFPLEQQHLHIYNKELIAMHSAVRRLRKYLIGQKVIFYTDNRTLFHNLKNPKEVDNACDFRRLLYISTFLEDVIFIEGIKNTTADRLSRQHARLNAVTCILTTAAIKCTEIDFHRISTEQLIDDWCTEVISSDPRAGRRQVSDRHSRVFALICLVQDETALVCVPATCIREVIRAVHSKNHFGIRLTTLNLQSSFVWPTLTKDVPDFIKYCVTCQREKHSKLPIIPIKLLRQPDERFASIHMDIIGPIDEVRGHKLILSIKDRFSKYVILVPLQNQSAEETWRAFSQHYLSRFACPIRIVTDNGRNFTSAHVNYFIEKLGCSHIYSTPYNPRSNGFIESPNKVITTLIRCLGLNWLDALPYVQLMMNNSMYSDALYTPAQMVFGCSQRMPFDLIELNSEMTQSEWTNDTIRAFKIIMFNLSPSTIQHHRTPVKPFIFKDMESSDLVWLRVDDSKRKKLESVFKGPYNVLERSDDYYTIELDNGMAVRQSLTKLKPAFMINPELLESLPVQPPEQPAPSSSRPSGRGLTLRSGKQLN